MEFMKKIEEISKKVGKTATDTYNTVADKSGKLIEGTKIKMAISDKESKMEDIFIDIGKTVYDMYQKGEDVGKEFTKESKKIEKIEKEIEQMQNRFLYNKGLRKCSACSEVIELESAFCGYCGEKQKPVKIKVEETKTDEKEEKKEDKVCPQCGFVMQSTYKFCSKCGYKL